MVITPNNWGELQHYKDRSPPWIKLHKKLLDNFEWDRGFEARFGLVEVDFKNQKRTPLPSAYVYKSIAQENGIHHKLFKLLGHGIRVEEVIKV